MEECREHSLICDVAVESEGRVLLVRYADPAQYDGEDGWFLPDDVLRRFEHPTKAATRIAWEQVGLELEDPRLGLIESFEGNDGTWHLSFHHLTELPSMPQVEPGPGIAEAEWFALDGLPPRDEVAHKGWALTVLKKMGLARTGG